MNCCLRFRKGCLQKYVNKNKTEKSLDAIKKSFQTSQFNVTDICVGINVRVINIFINSKIEHVSNTWVCHNHKPSVLGFGSLKLLQKGRLMLLTV